VCPGTIRNCFSSIASTSDCVHLSPQYQAVSSVASTSDNGADKEVSFFLPAVCTCAKADLGFLQGWGDAL
jgi:hypothetical protein